MQWLHDYLLITLFQIAWQYRRTSHLFVSFFVLFTMAVKTEGPFDTPAPLEHVQVVQLFVIRLSGAARGTWTVPSDSTVVQVGAGRGHGLSCTPSRWGAEADEKKCRSGSTDHEGWRDNHCTAVNWFKGPSAGWIKRTLKLLPDECHLHICQNRHVHFKLFFDKITSNRVSTEETINSEATEAPKYLRKLLFAVLFSSWPHPSHTITLSSMQELPV